jgi:hypothetical protein
MVAMVVDNTIFISPFDKALLSPALGDDARANPPFAKIPFSPKKVDMMVRLFFILLPKRQSVMSFVLHPSSFILHPSSFVSIVLLLTAIYLIFWLLASPLLCALFCLTASRRLSTTSSDDTDPATALLLDGQATDN